MRNSHDSTIGRQTTQLKKSVKPEQIFLQGGHMEGPETYEKMLSIPSHQREMQIRTTMRYHYTLVRMTILNKSTNNNCWRGCEEKGTLVHC